MVENLPISPIVTNLSRSRRLFRRTFNKTEQKALADFLYLILKTTNMRYTYLSHGKLVSNNQNFSPDMGGNYIINRVFWSYYSDVTSPGKPSAGTRDIEMQPFGCSYMARAHSFIRSKFWLLLQVLKIPNCGSELYPSQWYASGSIYMLCEAHSVPHMRIPRCWKDI